MIVRRFLTDTPCPVHNPKGGFLELVSIPIELSLTFQEADKEGFEKLQERVTRAVDKMVAELNRRSWIKVAIEEKAAEIRSKKFSKSP